MMQESKNRRHKIFAIILILVILLILAYLATSRIMQLNEKYPSPSVLEYGAGEEVKGGGIGITLTGMRLIKSGEIAETAPSAEADFTDEDRALLSTGGIKLLILDVSIKNHNTEEKEVALYDFCAQSGAWYNFIDPVVFPDLNGDAGLNLNIDAGETVEMRLPYLLYSYHFRNESEWENDKDRIYDLLLSTYPIKCVIHIREGEGK